MQTLRNSKIRQPKVDGVAHNAKISDVIINEIFDFIEKGHTYDSACAFAGVRKNTAYTWIRDGKKESESRAAGNRPHKNRRLHVALYEKQITYEEQGKGTLLAIVDEIAKNVKDDPANALKAATWILERKHKMIQKKEVDAKVTAVTPVIITPDKALSSEAWEDSNNETPVLESPETANVTDTEER